MRAAEICAACAEGAAAQGASIVVNDVKVAEADATVAKIRSSGGTAVSCVAAISNWNEAGRLVQTCIGEFGKIDDLVNNAALFHRSRLDEFGPPVARRLVDVNIMGTFYLRGPRHQADAVAGFWFDRQRHFGCSHGQPQCQARSLTPRRFAISNPGAGENNDAAGNPGNPSAGA